VIEFQDLTYSYPGSDQPALSEIRLRVGAGEFVGVVGANGAGKSTLCYALAGLLPSLFRGAIRGTVLVDGQDAPRAGPARLAGTVGLVLQNPFSQISGARFSVAEEVAFGLENLGVPRAEMAVRVAEALSVVGLSQLAERSPFELSGGEQQRLALAAILAMRPPVLLLDEPTSQLDPLGARDLIAAVDALTAATQTTVILVEQRLEWMAAHADRVIALDQGRIVRDGPPAEILGSAELEALGVRRTAYARAAEGAHRGAVRLAPAGLPATLEQARAFFA
jgi:energy-coupling factor transporter ATP-binding protein EcfA2